MKFKSLLILTGIIMLLSACKPSAIKCKDFRNGEFKAVIEGAENYSIIRRDGEQIEKVEGRADARFFVKWLDDCTYTLTPDSAYLADNDYLPKNATMTVRIVSTTDSSYFQSTTSTFSDEVHRFEIIRVK